MMNCHLPPTGRVANSVATTATVIKGRMHELQREPQIAWEDQDPGSHLHKLHNITNKQFTNITTSRTIQNPYRRYKKKKVRKDNHNKHSKMSIHGDLLGEKKEGHARLVFENFNGLAPWFPANDKIISARNFIRRLQADCYTGTECRAQWGILKHHNQLTQLFKTETTIRAVQAFNIHEDDTRAQEGGTAILGFDQFAGLIHTTGVDVSGLGRWCWISFKGRHNHITRIITAYQPCTHKKTGLSTVGAQHMRYYRSKNRTGSARSLFKLDLIALLHSWIQMKIRIILFIDANEDLNKGHLCAAFSRLHLRDLVKDRTHNVGPNTHFSGQHQIDGAFATEDIDCSGARFLPFWTGIGDHRAIVVDIPHQILFGEQLLRIVRPSGRKLQCDKPDALKKYHSSMVRQLKGHKIEPKIHRLTEIASYPPPEAFFPLQHQIDQVKTDIMISAESKCRKWLMGAIDYSPEVFQWKYKRDCWKLIRKKLQGYKICSRYLRRMAEHCGIIKPLSGTVSEAKKAYNICNQNFTSMKPKAASYRRKHLRDRLRLAKENGNLFKTARIKAVILREENIAKWRSINNAWSKRTGNSVSKVSIEINGVHQIFTTQEGVEDVVMKTCDKRFLLTYGSPLMDGGELHSDLGFLGDTPASQSILDGNYVCPPDTDEHVINLLNHFHTIGAHLQNHRSNTLLSTKDFITYWKRRKEKTSSSYSNLHFGHYKAAAHHPYIASLHAKPIELAFRTGSPLTRWTIGLAVMLEKIAGVILAEKLRAILLMEADFNFGNTVYMGRRMIKTAEALQVIPKETFGGRNDACPIEVPLCRLMFFDLVRQKKFNAALGSYDAQTCYDRVAHNFTSLAVQSVGTPAPIIITMLKAIQLMQFHLRTGFGDSDATYSGTTARPYQGLCQGNGAAPAIWLLISSFIIQYMRRMGHEVVIHAAISNEILRYVALLFVDDGDLPTMGLDKGETMISVAQRHQDAVDCWSGGLRVTGGALKPAKCFWFPIEWKWKNGVATPTKPHAATKHITIQDDNGIHHNVPRLEYHEFKEVMGVYQAPSGKMGDQLLKMKKKIAEFIPVLTNKYLPPRLVYTAFWGKLWPALKYPLPAMSMTTKESESLMKPLYKHLLPSLKIVGCLPREYRYSTAKYQGCGFPHFHLEQTIERLHFFMMHVSASTLVGQHIRHTSEQLQLELGIGPHFISSSFRQYGSYATRCWMSTLWQDISRLPITIQYSSPNLLKLQRDGDEYIMEVIIREGFLRQTQYKSFNRVRLFHQTYSLADILNGDGTRIRQSLFKRDRPKENSSFHWPATYPSNADFDLWNQTLLTIQSKWFQYNKTLGFWFSSTHTHITCYKHPTMEKVYIRDGHYWIEYFKDNRRPTRGASIYIRNGLIQTIPEGCLRGTYNYLEPTKISYEGCAQITPQIDTTPRTLQEVLQSWGNVWVWEYLRISDDGLWLAEALYHGSAVLVCDGSYQPKLNKNLGAAAWTIECSSTKKRALGVLISTTSTANAYRSELIGIYAALALTLAVTELYQLKEGFLLAGCDNEQGLYLSSLLTDRVSPKQKHSDVLRAIRHVRQALPLDIHFKHIYGHQDDTTSYANLERSVQLNIDCDILAKAGLKRFHKQRQVPPEVLPHEKVVLRVRGIKVLGAIGPPLRNEVARLNMRQFLASKGRLSLQGFDEVDWDAMEVKMASTPDQHRIWITKHVSGFCGTNHMLNKRKSSHSTICPCCKDPAIIENTFHQLHCTDIQRVELWEKCVKSLEKWLAFKQTSPLLITGIIRYVSGKGAVAYSSVKNNTHQLRLLSVSQDTIGWNNFMEGKISKRFQTVQQEYYTDIDSKFSSHKWASDLISRLLLMIHKQWIYRNNVVHKRRKDGLKHKEGMKVERKIEALCAEGETTLEPEDHYLMDDTLECIQEWDGIKKKIWIRSVEAAKAVKRMRYTDTTAPSPASPNRHFPRMESRNHTQVEQQRKRKFAQYGSRKMVRKKSKH